MKINFVKEQIKPTDSPIWYTEVNGEMVSGSCDSNREIAISIYETIVKNNGKNPFPKKETEKTTEL